jgi:glutathione S-transferase
VADLILHEYPLSPFSEKIRRILAYKRLPWRSVRAPAVMPKPDLLALTGGYRRIPVLQIDNHAYCDSSLIARKLEALAPEPTLYPTPLADSVAEWADTSLFDATSPVIMRPSRFDDLLQMMTKPELDALLPDRKAMGEDARRRPPTPKNALVHLTLFLARLDRALADRDYLFGSAPSIADFSAYHCCWILERVGPEPLAPHEQLRAWMARIAALPTPAVTPLSAADALRICRETHAGTGEALEFADPMGFAPEQAVCIRAADYGRDPIEGALVGSTRDEIVLRRANAFAGTVYVHFPRLGFEIAKHTPPPAAPSSPP